MPAVRVGYLLERCRLPVAAVSVERLLGELGADDDKRSQARIKLEAASEQRRFDQRWAMESISSSQKVISSQY